MGRLYKRGNVWWVKYYRGGRGIQESTRTGKRKEAERFLKIREGSVATGHPVLPRVDRIRYEEAVENLRKYYQMSGRRRPRETETRLAHLNGFFRHHRLAAIDVALITRYIVVRQEAGAAPATINRELDILRRMLRLDYEINKLFRVPPIKRLKEPPPRKGFFEDEAFQSVVKHLPDEVKPVATFAYHTGWRVQSEILPLTWPQVDFTGGVVRLEPGITKNQEGREFPLFPELWSLLEAQRTYTDKVQRERPAVIPWVFHRKGKPIRSFRKAWATACVKAGFGTEVRDTQGRLLKRMADRIPDNFRRTAVRNMIRKGIPERVAMQLTGRKTQSVSTATTS